MVRQLQKLFVSNLPVTGQKINFLQKQFHKILFLLVGTTQLKKYITENFGKAFNGKYMRLLFNVVSSFSSRP